MIVFVGLAEVEHQIKEHLLFEILTVCLIVLHVMSASLTEEEVFKHDVRGDILLIEARLTCNYNRNLAKIIADRWVMVSWSC